MPVSIRYLNKRWYRGVLILYETCLEANSRDVELTKESLCKFRATSCFSNIYGFLQQSTKALFCVILRQFYVEKDQKCVKMKRFYVETGSFCVIKDQKYTEKTQFYVEKDQKHAEKVLCCLLVAWLS